MNHTTHARLARKTVVAVAGCGGTGSQVLSGLARLNAALCSQGHGGIHVVAFDPDTVTRANLGRQLFSPVDLGLSKAQALVQRTNLFFGTSWNWCDGRYNSRDGAPFDIVIGCVDTRKARYSIKASFHGFKQPAYYLDCGNDERTGQVLLGCRYDKAEHYLPMPWNLFPDLFDRRKKEDDTPSCSLAEALMRQDLFINQKVATAACDLLWQLFRYGGTDYSGYFIGEHRVTPLPATPETWARLNPQLKAA